MIPTGNRITIKWITRNVDAIRRIRKRFNIPEYTTINGWSPAEISSEDLELFQETAKRGYFGILKHKWSKNGAHFSFKIRN